MTAMIVTPAGMAPPSPRLAALLQSAVDPGAVIEPTVRAEAMRLLASHRQEDVSPTVPRMRSWLLPLRVLAGAPLEAEFELMVPIYAGTCSDLPIGCMTPATQRAALASFSTWPAPSQVHAHLAGARDERAEMLFRLERLAEAREQADAMADWSAMDRHWLGYFRKREVEGFRPVRDGALGGREHVLSLIRQQAPRVAACLRAPNQEAV